MGGGERNPSRMSRATSAATLAGLMADELSKDLFLNFPGPVRSHSMSSFSMRLSTRLPDAREAAMLAALPAQIAHAQASTGAFAELLKGWMPPRSTAVQHWPSCP